MSYCLHQKKPTTQHKNAKQQYSFLIYANYQPLEKKIAAPFKNIIVS